MLDTDTKRRIDTARDILVGKVPDPKSQVEQITIALIYKFMDDMDLESEELGGARTFFAGDFARYGWAKLMRSGLGGHETLNLYAEAIARMPENPGIPPLFRDIFKNAYLPYRDPETLRAFLKIIDEFEYDHSERLGDAFEYLLSVLGSQGDAGQFRTPRHIIDFIVAIVDPKKNETVMDPACGTAGFLISSYKHILAANTIHMDSQDRQDTNIINIDSQDRQDKSRNASSASPSISSSSSSPSASSPSCSSCPSMSISTLTPDERARLAANFRGYDISPDMVRLSLVNLYLHGFADPHIYEYDTLTSLERWNETADVILANPPFMSPKGGIRPHNRFSVQSKRSEVLFVDYIAEHLTPAGRAGIIVPEGIIFQSQTAYTQLRKMLVEQALVAVISLPAGVFNPYSGVKTSILILDRALARRLDSVAFFKVEHDGFNLGAQRRPIEQNDLPEVLALAREWINHGIHGTHGKWEEDPRALVVPKARIAANGDYNLSGERYRENTTRSSNYELVPIGEICDLINGRAFKPEEWEKATSGGLPIVRIQNLNTPDSDFNYYTGEVSDRHVIHSGELLFSWSGSRGTSFGAHIWTGGRAVLNQHIFKVKFDNLRATKMYLLHALNKAVTEVEENLHGGVGLVHITKGDLEKIQIPLPPLEVQREIVAEIEGYQRVIDGARAVLDHYRPHIPIDPEWEMVELGEVLRKSNQSVLPESLTATVIYVGLENISQGIGEIIGETITENPADIKSLKTAFHKGEILYGKLRPNLNKVWLADREGICSTDIFVLQPTSDEVIPAFYATVLRSQVFNDTVMQFIKGAQLPRVGWQSFASIKVPLPPLPAQQALVAEIEAEQALVNANRELIARFERKIQATLARVWGEESDG